MQRRRPPPINTNVSRGDVPFTSAFAQLVVDVYTIVHYDNPAVQRLRAMRLDDPAINAARLHTFAFRGINQGVQELINQANHGGLTQAQLDRFVKFRDGMVEAGKLLRERVAQAIRDNPRIDRRFGLRVLLRIDRNIHRFHQASRELNDGLANQQVSAARQRDFMAASNNFIGNVYNLGPHRGGNLAVLDRWHLNLTMSLGGSFGMSPISRTLYINIAGFAEMSIPVTPQGSHIVAHGELVSAGLLSPRTEAALTGVRRERVNAEHSRFMNWHPFRSTQSAIAAAQASPRSISSSITALNAIGAASIAARSSLLLGQRSSSSKDAETGTDSVDKQMRDPNKKPTTKRRLNEELPASKKPYTSSSSSESSVELTRLNRSRSASDDVMEDAAPRASSQSPFDARPISANDSPFSMTGTEATTRVQPFEIESSGGVDPFAPGVAGQPTETVASGSASDAEQPTPSEGADLDAIMF